MKYKLASAALLIAVLFAGCQSAPAQPLPDIRPADAAQAIIDEVVFRDSLLEAKDEIAAGYYNLGEGVLDYAIFISGTGATAEEIAVLKASSADDVSAAEDAVNARLDALTKMYRDYRPDEMVKLQNPVIETRGDVVYFVLCEDKSDAQHAIEALYK